MCMRKKRYQFTHVFVVDAAGFRAREWTINSDFGVEESEQTIKLGDASSMIYIPLTISKIKKTGTQIYLLSFIFTWIDYHFIIVARPSRWLQMHRRRTYKWELGNRRVRELDSRQEVADKSCKVELCHQRIMAREWCHISLRTCLCSVDI